MSIRNWKVRINGGRTYIVPGLYPAEASSEAVVLFRKDETIDEAERTGPIWYIETQWVSGAPTRAVAGRRAERPGREGPQRDPRAVREQGTLQ